MACLQLESCADKILRPWPSKCRKVTLSTFSSGKVLLTQSGCATMKHTNTVTIYPGTASELTNEIGDLYYDALANHLHLLGYCQLASEMPKLS